ncbi:MAG: glycosyltransferase family 4 protein [Bacteroidetes bacterium]|nr:glycosyltransferase family 4 protein [Bacteroidota bacterium]
MKIVHIVPGFGGTFYCGNCLRDSAIVASLRQAGHDTVILPVYLPLVMNGTVIPDGPPVFYGAVSIYIKQMFPALRRMPGWLHRLLNSGPVLRYAARKAGSTRAHGLEALTESMLLGEDGLQREDLAEIVNYLKYHEKPDIVHFSNALLLGMAGMIRREVGVPVVCSLQDEDVWIDAMEPAAREKLWDLLAQRAAGVDALIAVSDWFASEMKRKMQLPEGKVHSIPIGIDTTQYRFASPSLENPTIGYLSRLCEENGLGILVDAFILLKKDPRNSNLKLRLTGGHTGDDRSFILYQMKNLGKNGLADQVEIIPEFDFPNLANFFSGLTLLSVPVLKGEGFGLYQLEAMASGIPVVQPALGAFPEIIERSGGGVVYHPNDAVSLAAKIATLLAEPEKITALGLAARRGAEKYYDCKQVTEELLSVYRTVLPKWK